MRATIGLLVGIITCGTAAADENGFRCLKSSGLRSVVKLQFDFPTEKKNAGYVTYQNGNGKIPVKSTNEKEVKKTRDGRPSGFETEWQEGAGGSSGKYVVSSQGARIYGFKYVRGKDGRIIEFEEDLEASGEKGCDWNKK